MTRTTRVDFLDWRNPGPRSLKNVKYNIRGADRRINVGALAGYERAHRVAKHLLRRLSRACYAIHIFVSGAIRFVESP